MSKQLIAASFLIETYYMRLQKTVRSFAPSILLVARNSSWCAIILPQAEQELAESRLIGTGTAGLLLRHVDVLCDLIPRVSVTRAICLDGFQVLLGFLTGLCDCLVLLDVVVLVEVVNCNLCLLDCLSLALCR